jgi:hypothetical protein
MVGNPPLDRVAITNGFDLKKNKEHPQCGGLWRRKIA